MATGGRRIVLHAAVAGVDPVDLPAVGTGFGNSVAMEGDLLVVGEPGASQGAFDRVGAVSVYRVDGATIEPLQRLTPPEPSTGSGYGYAVDVSGDRIVATGSGVQPLIWRRDGDRFELEATLDTGAVGDGRYGINVDLRGERLVLGNQEYDGTAQNVGAAWLFRHGPFGWELDANLDSGPRPTLALLGSDVALVGSEALIGVPFEQGFSAGPGVVLRFPFNADVDGDGVSYESDCDEDDAAIGPPAAGAVDLDGDGFGGALSLAVCPDAPRATTTLGDCDDADERIHPRRRRGPGRWGRSGLRRRRRLLGGPRSRRRHRRERGALRRPRLRRPGRARRRWRAGL
jgi:hypothetical protein